MRKFFNEYNIIRKSKRIEQISFAAIAVELDVGIVGPLTSNLPKATPVGNSLEEDKLLQFAHSYQMNTEWHKQMPNI